MPVAELGHVGLHVNDLDRSIRFYRDLLGLTVTDRDRKMGMAFLSARPKKEHHEVLLATGRTAPADAKLVQQVAFRCKSLEDVIEVHQKLRRAKVKIDMTVSHGNAVGVYFYDPDGNRCEMYWQTGLEAKQPWLEHLDLSRPPAELKKQIRESVRKHGKRGYMEPRFAEAQDLHTH